MIKKTKKYIRTWNIFLLILIMVVPVSVNAAETKKEIIRVGYFAFEGYHMQDENGYRSGYGYDFLQMVNHYNNFEYEYIGYDKSWGDMQKMLENGEIDMVTSAQMTEEQLEKFDFSEKEIGTSTALLMIHEDETRYEAGNYESYNGMRIGMVEDSSRNMQFEEFASEKGFTYTPVYYSSQNQMKEEFQSHRVIDAIYTSNQRYFENERCLEEINPSPYYVIVKKGNTELLEKINAAIEQMDINASGWRSELNSKYYMGGRETSRVLTLNEEELAYINEQKGAGRVFKVVMNPDRAPYSYFENGEARGIIPEIFQEAAARCGFAYEIIEAKDRQEYQNLIDSESVDIYIDSRFDYSYAESKGYKLSNTYLDTSISKVTRNGYEETENDVVATLLHPDAGHNTMEELYYNSPQYQQESVDACIQAVMNHKADVTYVYTYTAQREVNRDIRGRIDSYMLPEFTESFCFAVKDEIDNRCIAILDKSIESMKGKETQGIILKNTNYASSEYSLAGYLYARPHLMVALTGGLVLLFLFLGFTIIRIRAAKKEHEINLQLQANKIALTDALDTAREASKAKGNFMSRMSHEIRTPLNAVIGYMHMAKTSEGNLEKIMHCIDNSEMAARHLLSIINDVLDISSIESGKMKIANEKFDLKNLISTLTTIFYNQSQRRKVNFAVHIDELTEEEVVGDALRVNQVLMNLLSNAVKFTPENGTVTLEVKQMQLFEEEVHIRFLVQDTGIGMSREYLEKMFTPFEQESAQTAQKYGGSGLGLSITNNLVNMMKGSITVDSVQGEGSKFTVLLHFGRIEQESYVKNRDRDFSSIRVLIIDDVKNDSTYIKSLLKRCGVKADCVDSGEKALRRLEMRMSTDYAYDMCIIDWQMPQMNGIETAKKILEICGDEMPMIIATAYDVTSIEEEAKAAGVYKVISKPLFQSTMFDLLVNTYCKYEVKPEEYESYGDLTGLHVLLAEDNEMNMEIAVDILEKAGILVEQAVDGGAVYDKFLDSKEGTYQAILMDVQMPVMNGYEATKAIRSSNHPEAKTIPIIAMTANAFSEDVSAALAAGMNAHIAKPIEYAKLFHTLEKCFPGGKV